MKGSEEIAAMMEGFRKDPPKQLNGVEVIKVADYQLGVEKKLSGGETQEIDLPKSNVLQFFLSDGSKVSARPSGTEPKIKFYFSVNTTLEEAKDFDAKEAELEKRIDGIINSLIK